jgi:putative spermidine/putrescine transport system permease protein
MTKRRDIGKLVFAFITFVILFFLVFPILVTFVVSFNRGGFVLPPSGLTLKWYAAALTSREFLRGMYVSFVIGILSSGAATVMGLMISFAIARHHFRGRDLVNVIFMSPLVLPATIMGLALYSFLVILVGSGSGFFALLIGHTLLILPFAIRVILASLQNFDRSLEEAAMNVGAGGLKTFTAITLPIIKTGIIAGMMMCFIMSWNNFALSVFLAGSSWIPLPIEIYGYIKFQYDAVGAALVSALILISGLAIALLDKLVGLSIVMGIEGKG